MPTVRASMAAAIQTTSPLVARKSYWTVATTIESVGLRATPYHAHVPSFGEWGYTLAALRPIPERAHFPAGRFLTPATEAPLFAFSPDMGRRPVEVNRLDNQSLVRVFDKAWIRYES